MDPSQHAGRGAAGGDSARVRCLYCGANNFPASPTCWQCGRPLRAARSGPSEAPAAPDHGGAGMARAPGSAPAIGTSAPAPPWSGAAGLNPARSAKAAAALGLLFPYVGIPVGIVFLMLDDDRKAHLGWVAIGWSVLGTIANTIALVATLGPVWAVLRGLAQHPRPGGGLPGVPGLPDMGGGGADLLWPPLFQLSSALAAAASSLTFWFKAPHICGIVSMFGC